MRWLRRIARVVMVATLIAVVAELIHMAVTGQVLADKQLGMIGGAIFIVAVVFAAVFSSRRKRPLQLSSLVDDPHAIILVVPSPVDMKVLSFSFLVAGFGCALIALETTAELEDRIWPLAGVVLFVALPVVGLVRRHSVSLKLSPEGLDFSGFRTGLIAWADVRAATIKSMGKVRYIALELRDPQKYLARRPKSAWHVLEYVWPSSTFTFSPPAVGVEEEVILKAIQIRLSAFGQTGSTAA